MSIERVPSQQESQENFPLEIDIYVVEEVRTHKDTVTEQGFGYSTPLKYPEKLSHFAWRGRLQPTEYERRNPQSSKSSQGYTESMMSQDDIEMLAVNFAHNYRTRQNPDLQERGESSYLLKFEPSEKIIKEFEERRGQGSTIRGLNLEEQKIFMDAFRKANEEATKKK